MSHAMQNHSNWHVNSFERHSMLHRQPLLLSSRPKNQKCLEMSGSPEVANDFPVQRYPFANRHCPGDAFLKTTLGAGIEGRKLQELMTMTHPHLINIRKIVRGHPREANPALSDYFSFYYERVPYSLKRVAALCESEADMMTALRKVNFQRVLKDLTEYLLSREIYHEIRLDDVGVDAAYQIKVYLSPLVACGLERESVSRKQILSSNEALANWWKTTFSVRSFSPEDADQLGLPTCDSLPDAERNSPEKMRSNKSSFIVGESSQILGEDEDIDQMKISLAEERFKQLNYSNNISKFAPPYQLNSSVKQSLRSHVAEGLGQANELKCSQKSIKSELTLVHEQQQAKMRKIHEEVQNIKKKIYKTSFDYRLRKESDHILEKPRANQKLVFESAKLEKNCEAIQQNINCINIYNHSPSKARNANISRQPVFSYNILPLPTPNPQGLSQRHVEPTNDRSNTDNGSNASFEMEEHKSPLQSSPFRHSLEPKEEHPLLVNFRKIDKPSNSRSNQVKVAHKNVTESAGPLQFKSIISKLLKPEFAAKKSNIDEDPFEDESEQDSRPDIHHNNPPNNSRKSQVSNTPKPQAKAETQLQASSRRSPRVNAMLQLKNQKSENNFFKKAKAAESSLNARVQEVLLKTKNAIELLSRVKSNKSLRPGYVSP